MPLHADMVITYRTPESNQNKRYEYDTAVLKLALEKTRPAYGDYKMVPGKIMNYSRTHIRLKTIYIIFFLQNSVTKKDWFVS